MHLPDFHKLREQTRLASLVEACANTAVGYVIAYVAASAIVWAYDMQMSPGEVGTMTMWMTALSVLRGYTLRRLWNAEWWKRWNWRRPFRLQPRSETVTLKSCNTLPPDALLGLRPLTPDEQRVLLHRLRTMHAIRHNA